MNRPDPSMTSAPALRGFRGDLRAAQEGLLSLGFWALQVYRFGHLRYRFQSKLIRYPLAIAHLILAKFAESFCGVTIGVEAKIGERLGIEHSGCIVIHGYARLGDDCIVRQGVTIGNRRLDAPFDAPRLGHRVSIGAGAKILGAVTIGDDAEIGANAVVLEDVPAGAIAVGVPARIVRLKATAGVAPRARAGAAASGAKADPSADADSGAGADHPQAEETVS